jgi:hypothetical protein
MDQVYFERINYAVFSMLHFADFQEEKLLVGSPGKGSSAGYWR